MVGKIFPEPYQRHGEGMSRPSSEPTYAPYASISTSSGRLQSASPNVPKSQEVVARCGPHAKAWACERGAAPAREAGTAAGARPRAGAWPLGHQQPEILVHVRRHF